MKEDGRKRRTHACVRVSKQPTVRKPYFEGPIHDMCCLHTRVCKPACEAQTSAACNAKTRPDSSDCCDCARTTQGARLRHPRERCQAKAPRPPSLPPRAALLRPVDEQAGSCRRGGWGGVRGSVGRGACCWSERARTICSMHPACATPGATARGAASLQRETQPQRAQTQALSGVEEACVPGLHVPYRACKEPCWARGPAQQAGRGVVEGDEQKKRGHDTAVLVTSRRQGCRAGLLLTGMARRM